MVSRPIMFKWALVFAALAFVAGLVGFGVEGAVAVAAKALFLLFVGVFAVLLIAGIALGRKFGEEMRDEDTEMPSE